MKRYCEGLYGKDNYVVSKECDGLWVQRDVAEWRDGWPAELGDLGFSADTKRKLIEIMKEHGTH